MPLGLPFRRRRKPAVGDVATAAFQVASQPIHVAVEQPPSGTHGLLAASTELKNTASDSRISLELIPRDLWDEAYKALRGTDGKLVEQYEETIMRESQEDTHLEPVGSLARQEQLSSIVTRRLDSIEKDQKSFVVAGKTVALHEQFNKIVRIIMFARNFVSQAVSAEPHAALAWAGVCVLLPVSIEPFRLQVFQFLSLQVR